MTFRDRDAIHPALSAYPDANGNLSIAGALSRQPLGVTPRELQRRAVEAAQEAERPPSKRDRKRSKQEERRAARVRADVYPLVGSGRVILCDATHRIGGVCAAAVVHDGRIVAQEVFEASSSNRAEIRALALAARYADERGIDAAVFLCDNGGVVVNVTRGHLSIAEKRDLHWLRLFRHRASWEVEHVPRRMVREAHRAAAAALV